MAGRSEVVTKLRRQRTIRELVASSTVRTQRQLVKALARTGIEVSQGTLSRDLRELGVVKAAGGYAMPSQAGSGGLSRDDLAQALARFLVALRTAQNLVVLLTEPGGASALAQSLDESRLPEVVGTIAGDNTIFVATPDPAAARRLRDQLRRL